MVVIVGVLSFLIGLGAGVLLINILKPETEKVKTLTSELDALKETHDDYRHNVNAHFEDTARLMHQLTENYREVYRQLANDARNLCSEDVSSQLSLTSDKTPLPGEKIEDQDQPATAQQSGKPETPVPPRDYATKSSPDQKGSLAEDYGIKEKASGE